MNKRTENLQFRKIAFIHYPSDDLNKAIEFYRDLLGMKLLLQDEDWVEFQIGGQRLALHKTETNPTQEPTGAVVWLSVTAIEKTIKTLKEQGVRIYQPTKSFSWGKLAQFLDPFGNILGLYEKLDSK